MFISLIVCAGALVGAAGASAHAQGTRGGPQTRNTVRPIPPPPAQTNAPIGCFDAFGPNAGPGGQQGCVSLISDAQGFCLSSGGGGAGAPVREAPCSQGDFDEVWYVAFSGAHGTWEIWNAGSSCPSSHAWFKCGTPIGKQPQGNGYCVSAQAPRRGSLLVMEPCQQADLASSSWEGAGAPTRAWFQFQGAGSRARLCAASLPDGDYALERCSWSIRQNFAGGTLGDKQTSVTPPTTAPDPYR